MLYAFLLGTLAVWRLTHLLAAEDGPFALVARLRHRAGAGFWGELLDCFYCLSLWLSAPVAALLATSWAEGALLWLALSGGAILLERTTAPPPTPTFYEDLETPTWPAVDNDGAKPPPPSRTPRTPTPA